MSYKEKTIFLRWVLLFIDSYWLCSAGNRAATCQHQFFIISSWHAVPRPAESYAWPRSFCKSANDRPIHWRKLIVSKPMKSCRLINVSLKSSFTRNCPKLELNVRYNLVLMPEKGLLRRSLMFILHCRITSLWRAPLAKWSGPGKLPHHKSLGEIWKSGNLVLVLSCGCASCQD